MPVVTKIPARLHPATFVPLESTAKRKVAGYARVSTDSEEQQTSYAAQVSYYTDYIQKRPDWEFVGVYTDEGISATNTRHRDGFNRMIADALDGKIDLIVTKSVSRFARNTVDSLTTVRGNALFSAKIICNECGHYFGAKVWHSTSKYRRVIWQCNGKFKYETHCSTPHFYEDEIKERFITAFNQFFQNKELVLEACETAIAQLSSTDSIEEKVNILAEELELILMEKRDYVLNHIRDEINHFEFDRKCAEFDRRYNEKAEAYNRLQEKLVQRQSRAEFLQKLYSRIEAVTGAIDFFDAALWRTLIEKATVHHDGRIIFKFLDGTEIEA